MSQLIFVDVDNDCVFAEVALSPLLTLEGSGISLPDALRDLATQIEDEEKELGYDFFS